MGQESWTVGNQGNRSRSKPEPEGEDRTDWQSNAHQTSFGPRWADHENPKLRIEDPDSKKATTIYVIWDPIGATSTTHTSMITVGPQVSHAMARC